MQTRIRFKYDDGEKGKTRNNATIAVSRQSFKTDDGEVYLFLHLKDFYFELLDNDGNAIHRGGNATNTAVLLRQAKRELEKRGCKFGTETRKKVEEENSSDVAVGSETNQESRA